MAGKPPPIELPPRYYLDYFRYVLDFMRDKYGHILTVREHQFLEVFEGLSEDAQCLAVRMANRRGEFFLLDTFKYPEIGSIRVAGEELQAAELVASPTAAEGQWHESVLHLFPKSFLLKLAKTAEAPAKSQWKKGEVVEHLLAKVPYEDALAYIGEFHQLVRIRYGAQVEMFKFLFFGNLHEDMTQFVVRDIGYVRYESDENRDFTPLFATRKEAEDKLEATLANEYFKVIRETDGADEVLHWYLGWVREHVATLSAPAQATFDKLTLRVGQWLERQARPREALTVFEHTQQPPARERRVRLLKKLGEEGAALDLAEGMVADAKTADERLFARDFLAKHADPKRRRRSTTEKLKAAEVVGIARDYERRVELGVVQHYADQGYSAVHSENYLWRAFFGLFFWDLIFDGNEEVFHHPLQNAPSDLFSGDFLKNRKRKVKARLKELHRPEQCLHRLHTVFAEKEGISNPFTGWHPQTLDLVETCYRLLEPQQVEAVLWEMATNLRENVKGFPDLFVWRERDYGFVEVKSPNDHLGPQQWHWLDFFERHGIQAKILRVEWQD